MSPTFQLNTTAVLRYIISTGSDRRLCQTFVPSSFQRLKTI